MTTTPQNIHQKKSKLKRTIFLSLASIAGGLFVSFTLYFYYATIHEYKVENERIKQNYIALQKNLIRTRVEQTVQVVESMRATREDRLRTALKARVTEAHKTATYIYEKYSGIEPEESVKRRIKDAFESMRFDDGKSYIWIVDYNNIAVLSPNNKRLEGKSLAFVNKNGEYVVKNQSKTAKEQREGFLRDSFFKVGEPPEKMFEQLTFVKDFGHYGWYFGSAVFLDEFYAKLKDDVLNALAGLRFDNNYIFVDTTDGYALLMNGKKLEKPEYVLELTDKNGIKIIKEQLKAAASSPNGGYVEYVWHESSLGKDMPHLSYCRLIKDWGWKIGTGLYIGKINDEIDRRREELKQKLINDTIVFAVFVFFLLGATIYATNKINEQINELTDTLNEKDGK